MIREGLAADREISVTVILPAVVPSRVEIVVFPVIELDHVPCVPACYIRTVCRNARNIDSIESVVGGEQLEYPRIALANRLALFDRT